MSHDDIEMRVYKDNEPALYEFLESMTEAGVGEVVLEGQTYSVAKDKDEDWISCFILVPFGGDSR